MQMQPEVAQPLGHCSVKFF